jgi:Tol biopolymer transport system component
MTPSRAATRQNRSPSDADSGSFGPVWSPDGSKIAFFIMADKEWHLGLVNADGSGFRFVQNAGLKSDAFGAPAWARDGKSIFCHDLDNLYHIDLDGNVLKKWALSKVLTEASMNGNDRLSVSPDGTTLLTDVDLGAEHERKTWDGPQPAIYAFNLDTEKTTRITAKEDFVWDPCWLTNDEFLCVIQKEHENEPSLYRMPSNSRNPKLLVKHAERERAAVLAIIRSLTSSLPQARCRPSWDQFHRLARSPVDPHLCRQRSARLPE